MTGIILSSPFKSGMTFATKTIITSRQQHFNASLQLHLFLFHAVVTVDACSVNVPPTLSQSPWVNTMKPMTKPHHISKTQTITMQHQRLESVCYFQHGQAHLGLSNYPIYYRVLWILCSLPTIYPLLSKGNWLVVLLFLGSYTLSGHFHLAVFS